MVVGCVGPLGDKPCGEQEKREGLLCLVAQEDPAGERGDGPEQDCGRPVLLNVEYLANERDGRAGGDGSDGMKHGGERMKPLARHGAGEVEDSDQDHDGG